jgi:YD repeat-containing protein
MIQELIPPVDGSGHYEAPPPGQPYSPPAPCWVYGATPAASFYTPQVGSAQRLPNGNTLICEGTMGRFFEIGPDSQLVWTYINPVIDTLRLHQGDTVPRTGPHDLKNIVHRSPRYAPDYAGLQGHDLTPRYPVERYGSPSVAVAEPAPARRPRVLPFAAPNPFTARTAVRFTLPPAASAGVAIYSGDGRLIRTIAAPGAQHGVTWDGCDDAGRRVSRGIYYCRPSGQGIFEPVKLIKLD